VNDWIIDLGISALLRVLRDTKESNKWRRAFLKLFKLIAERFSHDEDFQEVALEIGGSPESE
jgi:hypothetical protein